MPTVTGSRRMGPRGVSAALPKFSYGAGAAATRRRPPSRSAQAHCRDPYTRLTNGETVVAPSSSNSGAVNHGWPSTAAKALITV